jgi:hypothetical protein
MDWIGLGDTIQLISYLFIIRYYMILYSLLFNEERDVSWLLFPFGSPHSAYPHLANNPIRFPHTLLFGSFPTLNLICRLLLMIIRETHNHKLRSLHLAASP